MISFEAEAAVAVTGGEEVTPAAAVDWAFPAVELEPLAAFTVWASALFLPLDFFDLSESSVTAAGAGGGEGFA